MHNWLHVHKPAAPAQVHLLLAAVMWTLVGATLLLFGLRWALAGQTPYALLLLAAAVAAGLLKAELVFKRTARRLIERIRARGDGYCVGGFLSLRSWAFVALMAGTGRLLRGSLLPRTIVGLVYVAIGTALLLATRWLWRAWYRHNADA